MNVCRQGSFSLTTASGWVAVSGLFVPGWFVTGMGPAERESTTGWLTFAAEGGGGAKGSPRIRGFSGMPLTLGLPTVIVEAYCGDN
ncbi:hypothetical protein Pure05_31020 [Paenarthrobacter ureafaciens]|nr:hypothetical protein Pure01_31040 [Paenarthrobacter ureafaciens]GLU64860.1 hypothetical protein Pure02_31100 [Paenarthrobacter ureafaciens]GLU69307.1 hypothetical protein Pure03_32830 [Paenarthrobacter ureafaciens]GLU73565.1 hypothetical protein Pure04_32800 [Paenarthrobacter ureafaciens]GLU77662.1 hypothetical protein Pure05_31020 [Paenarthrobacter ureafaciens]